MLKVSVIVPVYNNPVGVEKLLSTIEKQSIPKELFEVIVVDNGSTDNTIAVLHRHQKLNGEFIRLVREPLVKSSYAARNTGINSSSGAILAFTDADCITAENWLAVGLDTFAKYPESSRLAGSIQMSFQSNKLTSVELYEKVFAFQQEKAANQGWAITANMFVARKVFESVGLFDPELKSGGDREWGLRAAAAGHPIKYIPELLVIHPARRTYGELHRKTVRMLGGRWALAYKAFLKTPSVSSMLSKNLPEYGVTSKVDWFPGLKKVFTNPTLNSPFERFRVLCVIILITVFKLIEYWRLRFGARLRGE